MSKAVTILVWFCVGSFFKNKGAFFFEKELGVTVQDNMTLLSTEEVKVNLQQ